MDESVKMEREAIETTYSGTMDIYEMQEITVRGRTRQEKVFMYNEIKCALSKRNPSNVYMNSQYGEINCPYEIFTNPETKIKAGSIIHIKQDGMELELENVGEPHIYPTHQEIICQRKDKA